VFQVQSGELRAAWSHPDSPVRPAQFSPDGRLLVLGDGTGQARVWDAVTGQAVTSPLKPGGILAWAGFHDGGKQVFTLSTAGTVCFWRLPSVPEGDGAVPEGERAAAEGVAVDRGPSPIRLESGAAVSGGRVTAGPLRPPGATDRRVEQAVFSPDGLRVVVRDRDGTARVWDAATGKPRTPPLRHGGVVLYGAFSPDGSRLLTAGDDRTAREWDAATGEALTPPLHHGRAIAQVFFRAEGDQACVVQDGGVVCAWDLTPERRPVEELRAVVQAQAAVRGSPRP
jgi:WD40 repeat protein